VDALLATDPHELALLDDSQELRLQGRRELADLVQEDRALIRELELPELLLDRVGERASLVPEELAFEQILGDGGAVERDERLLGSRALVVQGLGDELLPGTRSHP